MQDYSPPPERISLTPGGVEDLRAVLRPDRSQASAAFEDALRQYESALALQPADDRERRANLLFKRGLALRSLGRWDEALADWRQALDAYEELGEAEAVGRTS